MGLVGIIIGILAILLDSERADGVLMIKINTRFWFVILTIAIGYKFLVNAIDTKLEPIRQRKNEQWMLKNNVTGEMIS